MATLKISARGLERLVKGFSDLSILVLGDVILDAYIWGEVDRICPEAPVPVVDVRLESKMLGGAGNVVSNIKTLGGDVSLCGVIGNDPDGQIIGDLLKKKNVNQAGVFVDNERPTTKKTRIVAGHQQVVRFDHESRERISDHLTQKIYHYLEKAWDSFDAVILSDYGKGFIHQGLLEKVQTLNEKSSKIVSVDPKERNMHTYKKVSLITPNKKEASIAAGKEIRSESDLKEAGRKIIHSLQCENLVITLGAEGMALFKRNGDFLKIPTFAKEVFDVSGAGDTVVSTITLALAAGASLPEAAVLANYAAGVVVGKLGTAHVSDQELIEYIREEKKRVNRLQWVSESYTPPVRVPVSSGV